MRNAIRMALVSLAVLASAFAIGVQPAAAAELAPASVGACANWYPTKTTRLAASGNYYYDFTEATAHRTEDCTTISVRSLEASSVCTGVRVRIFPSSGGSITRPYANGSFAYVCGGQAADLAVGFLVGTKYRVETTRDNMDFRVRD